MKLRLLVGAVSIFSGAALVLACSVDSVNTFVDEDAGSSGTSGKGGKGSSGTSGTSGSSGEEEEVDASKPDAAKPDAGSSSGNVITTPKNTKVRAGDLAGLVGVTTGPTPHAVYYIANGDNYDLEAVPVAGGAHVVLQAAIADDDYAFVSGGAVAWNSGTNPTTEIATSINVWTKAAGTKPVVTPTLKGIFSASDDGVNVAFSTNATADKTDVALTTSAAPTAATPALSGANAVNLAALRGGTCNVQIAFAGSTLVGSYCTGVAAAATQPRLVTATVGGAAVVRIGDTVPAEAIESSWLADATGTKLFVRGPAPDRQGRVVITNAAATTVANVENNVAGAAIAKDGSAVVYLTEGGALKKAALAATPAPKELATAVLGFTAISSDSKRALFYTQETPEGLTNVQVVDLTAAVPAPVAIVATPTALSPSFTGSGSHVVYLDELAQTTAKLKSKPVAGGAEKLLDAASTGVYVAPVGNGVLTITASASLGSGYYADTVKFVDAVAGGALQNGATDVLYSPNGGVSEWSGKTYVHTNAGETSPGLYTLTLP